MKKVNNTIPIFIPSYHRPYNIKTMKYLFKLGYPKELIYVFIDSEADDKDDYKKEVVDTYGCNLVIFDIDDARKRYDFVHRPSQSRRAAGLCRNTFYDFAKENNIDFYLVIDDDTISYQIRPFFLYGKESQMTKKNSWILFELFENIKEFMLKRNIGVFGLVQSGDMIGGKNSYRANMLMLYKVMNTTFYNTKYIYRGEKGIQDDDTSQFVHIYNEGLFTGTVNAGINLVQANSAKQKGGLTDLYKENKLLNKSLVTPIQFPSAIRAEYQYVNGGRLHHRIYDRYLRPRLIKVKKGNNIAWDTYPEDIPFTNEPKRK